MFALEDIVTQVRTLQTKVDKLKRLILYTDPVLGDQQCGSDIQIKQWAEYIKCFPDEDNKPTNPVPVVEPRTPEEINRFIIESVDMLTQRVIDAFPKSSEQTQWLVFARIVNLLVTDIYNPLINTVRKTNAVLANPIKDAPND